MVGLDPEIVQAGITLAGYHIEAGARSFAAYSKAMLDDLGDGVGPYLRSWYEGVRYYPGFNAQGMTPGAEIDTIADAAEPQASTEPKQMTLDQLKAEILAHWRRMEPKTAQAQPAAWLAKQAEAQAAMAMAEIRANAMPKMSERDGWTEVRSQFLGPCPKRRLTPASSRPTPAH